MRSFSRVLLLVLCMGAVALLVWRSQVKYSSTTFAGPEFHTLNAADISKVASDLSLQLEAQGFKKEGPPSAMDSWAGVHSHGAKRSWFVRRESGSRALWVSVDVEAVRVATSVKWENHGMEKSKQATEGKAYRLALELDDWFLARSEKNLLPADLVQKKRDWFIGELERGL